jgi:curved DNA-binding protein CbpA
MGIKNPFEVLGITPAMVRSLEGKELFSLVRSSYRSLQLIYHPDRSPLHDQALKLQKTQKVAEINLAFEKLDLDRAPDSLNITETYISEEPGTAGRKLSVN